MIKIIIEVLLKFPFYRSMDELIELCNIWQCNILRGDTRYPNTVISMPLSSFKRIFGMNPIKGKYEVPAGTEHFITGVKVKDIKAN